jgi:neutral amino acid transport system ATP-binding protein
VSDAETPSAAPAETSPGDTIEELEAVDVVEARAELVGSHERAVGPRAAAAKAALADVTGEPGVAKPDPILLADGVRRSFGGLVAVDVDHLEVQRGSITALIGPNGAGKTTLFNLLTGFDKPDSGRWRFVTSGNGNGGSPQEHDLAGVAAYKVSRLGMVRTFQLTKSLSRLSVIENMKLGATGQAGESFFVSLIRPAWRAKERSITTRAESLLERFRLAHMRDEYAGSLSGGQRKLLEMARALMVEPEVIMLDEPMAGVNPALTQSLLGHVKDLREDGMTVVFVEHDMDVVYDISDWVVVMAEGRIIAEGPPDAIGQNQEVIDAYLGAHHDAPLTEEEEARQLAEAEAAIAAEETESAHG